MPTVLITGINGFVAVHTAVKYLENGWNVRGTVRSADKGDKALGLPCFKQYKDKIDYVIVEDLIKGDFSEALKGVDAIAHCASPWHFNGKKWAEYRDPAVKGTTNILEQAAKVESESQPYLLRETSTDEKASRIALSYLHSLLLETA
jgi:nucleoside-diphosphate-sugar epimerase